jgi:uncharacterized phage protein (TIGR02220 family)
MAIYRNVHISFWTDAKVADEMTPEDKYFFLYLLTNPHGNILGCYEFSFKQAEAETGYQKDTIRKLIDRMKNVHHVIDFDEKTREILVIHWYRYNWSASERLKKSLYKTLGTVKTQRFRDYLQKVVDAYPNNTVCIPYVYPIDTVSVPYPPVTVSVSVSESESDTEPATGEIYSPGSKRTTDDAFSPQEVVQYLNQVCGTHYRASSKKTQRLIHARQQEGFTLNDFKIVIDKKAEEWGPNPDMCKYLRPETLFGTKFESYLNQQGRLSETEPADSSWLSLLGGEEDDA